MSSAKDAIELVIKLEPRDGTIIRKEAHHLNRHPNGPYWLVELEYSDGIVKVHRIQTEAVKKYAESKKPSILKDLDALTTGADINSVILMNKDAWDRYSEELPMCRTFCGCPIILADVPKPILGVKLCK